MDQNLEEPRETVGDALARARKHARAAVAESVAALHALLDAGSLATLGSPAAGGALSPVADVMGRLEGWLAADTRREGALFDAMLDALDGEIGRWEQRSRTDPDARTVLRAFLGVRELLWELGRQGPDVGAAEDPHGEAAGDAKEQPATRLRRVNVQG